MEEHPPSTRPRGYLHGQPTKQQNIGLNTTVLELVKHPMPILITSNQVFGLPQSTPVEPWLRNGMKAPRSTGVSHGVQVAQRHVNPWVGVRRASFKHEHLWVGFTQGTRSRNEV
jgi:hypothetical protein